MFYWPLWSMHVFWWVFWALMIVLFFSLAMVPASRSRGGLYEDPLAILRRRYARGEITAAELEERREVLRRTSDDASARNDDDGSGVPGRGGAAPAHG
jgi:putative membrane protein